MRISDWSSDVCSSDLIDGQRADLPIGMPVGKIGQGFVYRLQLGFEFFQIAAMVARQRTDNAGLAARDGQVHAAAQEHRRREGRQGQTVPKPLIRSEEHTSELQSLMRISYAVFCLNKTINIYSFSASTTHSDT